MSVGSIPTSRSTGGAPYTHGEHDLSRGAVRVWQSVGTTNSESVHGGMNSGLHRAEFRPNQKWRSQIRRLAARSEPTHGRPPKSDWDRAISREKLATKIKRNLFANSAVGDSSIDDELAEISRLIDEAVNRIPRVPVCQNVRSGGHISPSGARETTPEVDGPNRNSNGLAFGRSVEDIFAHSWHVEPRSRWVWMRKPAIAGDAEYPARVEEVRREGWRARRLVRTHPPPPLTKSFASALSSGEMNRDNQKVMWGDQGTSKRRIEEERMYGDGGRGNFHGEIGRRDERAGRDFFQGEPPRDRFYHDQGCIDADAGRRDFRGGGDGRRSAEQWTLVRTALETSA